jgi:hypothetical protein
MEQVVQSAEEVLTSNDVLKLTALLYFKEALQKQEFESCAELVAAASKFGASKEEISEVIALYLKGEKPGGQTGSQTQTKNRVRSLKENT